MGHNPPLGVGHRLMELTALYRNRFVKRQDLPVKDCHKRQDFSHRGADAKSLLDEVLRRGREERAGAGWKGEYGRGGRGDWGAESRRGFLAMRAA